MKSLSGSMKVDKIKKDLEVIETINIELDHRVSKLIAENEHLKQNYKKLYDSIKSVCIRSNEQYDDLINQVNLKSMEIYDLNASLQEKVLVIIALKDDLRKLKGKALVNDAITSHSIALEMLKVHMEPLAPKLLNNRTAHSDYLSYTQEQASILREKPTGKVFTNIGYTWRPTGRTFPTVGNACPLTRITITAEVPLREPTALESDTPTPMVTLVSSRKPNKSKNNVLVSKSKTIKSLSANKKEPNKSWGSTIFDVLSSSLDECRLSKLFFVKFKNDHVAKILGYGDYQIGNVMMPEAYYVEGHGHSLFSVVQFCDSNLSSTHASKTKSWLWHRRVSHLNFGAINHLARQGLVRGLPKLKFKKDHLCSACVMGKSKKKPYKPKYEDTNKKNSIFCTCIFVDQCVSSKDEAPDFIIKFLKMIAVRLKVPVGRIKTDNGIECVNQTLREYYEKVRISYETFVTRSPQQNGVVERRNRMVIEVARTMLIYGKAPLFLWEEAVMLAVILVK
nr:hypothetical protein [Tanacetum cinerariifolium]